MDLKQLRTFVHIAQLGSISLAAERLNVAQSALTRQIQALEAELQVKLLRRHGRGVDVTPEGELLQHRAAIILREVEQARHDMNANPSILRGALVFAMPSSVSDVMAGALIEKFSRLYPHVQLHAASGGSGYVLDWLQRGVADIAVIYDVKPPANMHLAPLPEQQLYLIGRRGSSRTKSRQVRLEDVVAMPLVLAGRQHGLRMIIDNVAAANGLTLTPVVEADSVLMQLDLVQRGIGVTILPYLSVADAVAAGTLSAKLITNPQVIRRMAIARPIDRPASAVVHRFSELITAEVAELVHTGRWDGHP